MRSLLLLTCAVTACHHPAPEAPAPLKIHCAPVEERSITDVCSVRGTVSAAPERGAILSAQVAGRLLHVLVHEGDRVQRGQPVAEIESQPLADLLHQAEAALAGARASREAAAAAATRAEHLYTRGIAARQALEAAQASLKEIDATVSSSSAQVELARRNLQRATLRATLSGVVVRTIRQAGELVDGTPATPILEIADPDALELAASAPPSDLVRLAVGQKAVVRFEALPGREVDAVVHAVAPGVDRTSGVGKLRLRLVTGSVRPPFGILGEAEVIVGAPRQARLVPKVAVRNAGGAQTEVVVCDGGHARVRAVTLGDRREDWVEVVRGLEPGLRVAIDEVTGLGEGAAIEPLP